jgi:hypothetical protein
MRDRALEITATKSELEISLREVRAFCHDFTEPHCVNSPNIGNRTEISNLNSVDQFTGGN